MICIVQVSPDVYLRTPLHTQCGLDHLSPTTWDGFNLHLHFTDPYEKYKQLDGQAMHYCRLAPNAAVRSDRWRDPATPSCDGP